MGYREDRIKRFLQSSETQARYREAVNLLQGIGFEALLRSLGEPAPLSIGLSRRSEIAAFDHAEKKGWHDCLDYLFRFDEMMRNTEESEEKDDQFGVRQILREHGYSEEEIDKAL